MHSMSSAVNAVRSEGTKKRDRRRTQPLPEEAEGGHAPAAPGAGHHDGDDEQRAAALKAIERAGYQPHIAA